MKVHFKQGWGIGFTIGGTVMLLCNFWLMSVGFGNPIQLLLSAIIILVGIMYLVQPYFELRSNEIVLFNLFGMEIKRFTFGSYADFQVIDGKVFVNTQGKLRKVRIGKLMAKPHEWDKFISTISGDDLTRELHNI
ncbi:MAG TPA: hypothetical protein VK177_05560 [Flavobacteriales bacterium]|nr:hypothetical protein [Flavobacteriales bacterium]